MRIDTDKTYYTVGDTVKANFTLINNSSQPIQVQNFQRSLLHYMKQDISPISLGHGFAGIIEITGYNSVIWSYFLIVKWRVHTPSLLRLVSLTHDRLGLYPLLTESSMLEQNSSPILTPSSPFILKPSAMGQ